MIHGNVHVSDNKPIRESIIDPTHKTYYIYTNIFSKLMEKSIFPNVDCR